LNPGPLLPTYARSRRPHPAIIERVLGRDNVAHRNLSGLRGDLAMIHRRLILLACIAKTPSTYSLPPPLEMQASSLWKYSNICRRVSATSSCLLKNILLPSMSACPSLLLLAGTASKSYNIIFGNTASHPSLQHSTAWGHDSPLVT
jgi:hypothetical protein